MNTNTPQTVNMRDLARNLKKITSAVERGASFTVLRNAKPVFRIAPMETDEVKTMRLTLKDFARAQFKGPKNLSAEVDKIVYGV